MLLKIEIEIPDEMRLLSLQGKNDGTWTAAVKVNEPFYINSPCGVGNGTSPELAISAAIVACRHEADQYAKTALRESRRDGPSNGVARNGPEKLSELF